LQLCEEELKARVKIRLKNDQFHSCHLCEWIYSQDCDARLPHSHENGNSLPAMTSMYRNNADVLSPPYLQSEVIG
jgi:hypothetical protein